ncbi:MAG: LOG family protein, partial [Ilumatobacteraceae bacterium]
IMEAGMVGAGRDNSIGVSIRLPFETSANEVIQGDTKYVSMRYFFTRKLMLVKESHAFICMPGGFGTLDEMFELLTLTQTGKGLPVPILLMDLEHDPYWESIEQVINEQLLPRGLISRDDLALFSVCHSPEEAVRHIAQFYSNYRSMRFVGSQLVLRLSKPVSDELLDAINAEFGHLCKRGGFERVSPLPPEMSDDDDISAHRIAFHFVRRGFGDLRRLINHLNQYG